MYQVTDDISFTSALIIGLLQVATMTELAIQVKLSAEQMQTREAKRKIKRTQVSFFWLAGLIFGLSLFQGYLEYRKFYQENATEWQNLT